MVGVFFLLDKGTRCLVTSPKGYGHKANAPLEASKVPTRYQSPYGMTSYFYVHSLLKMPALRAASTMLSYLWKSQDLHR